MRSLAGSSGQHLLAELLIVLEAVQCLLGRCLVGLFLAVAVGIAGIDASQDDGSAEYGVLVGIGVAVNELKLDGDPVLLGPLDES